RGAHPRRGPGEHLRRPLLRRRGLHRARLRGVPGARFGCLAGGEAGGGRAVRIPDPRDIIIEPVISEKSYGLQDQNQYTFLVRPDANKTQIKIAVEKIFEVKVDSVNTVNRKGKRKRTRFGYGKRPDTKRAIVKVADGDRIDI